MPDASEDARTRALGALNGRGFDTVPARSMRLPKRALDRLRAGRDVASVSEDGFVTGMMASRYGTANAPAPFTYNDGFNGAGVGVAIIDSGVAVHGDLANFRQYDFTNGQYPRPTISSGRISSFNSQSRVDPYGHGTHVAGVVAGGGDNSWGYEHAGLAPDARLLSLRVLDGQGRGRTSDAIAALDWLLTYGRYFDVKVANLSFGKAVEESNTTDPLVLAAERVWDAGITVVVSAGNYGRDGHMTITSPGNSRKVITVGSLTDKNTGSNFADDFVSTYSSMRPDAHRPRAQARPGRPRQPADLDDAGQRQAANRSGQPRREVQHLLLQQRLHRAVRHQHGRADGGGDRGADAGEGADPDAGHHQGTADALRPQGVGGPHRGRRRRAGHQSRDEPDGLRCG